MAATYTLCSSKTTTGPTPRVSIEHRDLRSSTGKTLIQSTINSGTGTATVVLEGQLEDIGWVPLVTFSMTASGAQVSEGAYVESFWRYLRINITSNSASLPITAVVYRESGT